MKKLLFTLLLGSMGFGNTSVAQENSPELSVEKKNFFYIAPLDLIFNTIQIGYERKLKNNNSIALNGGFKLSKKNEIIHRLGGNGEFQYRINLRYNKNNYNSFIKNHSTYTYFAPFIQYRYEEITDAFPDSKDVSIVNKENTYVNSSFAGFGFGVRVSALENRFSLNLFAGGGMKYSDVKGDKSYADFTEVGYTGIAPKISFQIGVAF